jgi:Protein of unknown function (DUF3667)
MTQDNRCLNCGHELGELGKFCSNCGQEVKPLNIKFKDIILDFLSDFFTFDSKFFRSFIPLFLKPGRLTVDYLSGKRIRYIPPVRLFLFVSIVFFFILSFQITDDMNFFNVEDNTSVVNDSTVVDSSNGLINSISTINSKKDSLIHVMDTIKSKFSLIKAVKETFPDSDFRTQFIIAQLIRLEAKGSKAFFNYLLGQGTFILLIIIPFFALFLKLIYIRRKIYFNNHLVFSFHLHAFILLFLSLLMLLNYLTGPVIFFLLIAVIPVYLYLALKTIYVQKVRKTIFKTVLTVLFYFLGFIPIVFLLVLFVGFILF